MSRFSRHVLPAALLCVAAGGLWQASAPSSDPQSMRVICVEGAAVIVYGDPYQVPSVCVPAP